MGVERFFSSLKRDYNFIHNIKRVECEHFLIDFNSIVHVTSQFLLEKEKKNSITKEEFEIKLIENVGKYIEELIDNNFDKLKLLTITICVDGVPTMAKIYEQKKRRYMGEILSKINSMPSTFSWSRNNISPGTDFMNNLMEYLNSSIFEEKIRKLCVNLKHLNISDINQMGEGEIKIMHYIDVLIKKPDYKRDKIIVYSPDSDVIILLLLKSIEDLDIFMLRYDQQLSTEALPIYSLVDINHFKNILFEIIQSKVEKKLDIKNIIRDLVYILTVFGDDFLPKLETLRVNTDIKLILEHYTVNLIKYGYIITTDNNNNRNYLINTENFLQFLTMLEKKEEYFLRRNARSHVISNINRIISDIVGHKMNILREHIVNYLWKFCYLNKPAFIKISPVNACNQIDESILIEFMNNKEPEVNKEKLEQFSKLNMKDVGNLWSHMIKIIEEYYIEILQIIDGKKMKDEKIYSNEVFYILSLPNQLLKDIILYFYKTYEMPITVGLKTDEPKILLNKFYSTSMPHANRLDKKPIYEREQYKIENKLDKYFKILNPQDKFYYDIYFSGTSSNEINYNKYYSLHFNTSHVNRNSIVNDYLSGLNWVLNYYYNCKPDYSNIDLTWYYLYGRSPLLKDIIRSSVINIINQKQSSKNIKKYMTPLEHYIFVSPFDISKSKDELIKDLNKMIGHLSKIKIEELLNFMLNNKKYYYDLNKIFNDLSNKHIIDCSVSIFLSKCHLLFLEKYIDMSKFLQDIRH
jgi:5'-3' exonuclease